MGRTLDFARGLVTPCERLGKRGSPKQQSVLPLQDIFLPLVSGRTDGWPAFTTLDDMGIDIDIDRCHDLYWWFDDLFMRAYGMPAVPSNLEY